MKTLTGTEFERFLHDDARVNWDYPGRPPETLARGPCDAVFARIAVITYDHRRHGIRFQERGVLQRVRDDDRIT